MHHTSLLRSIVIAAFLFSCLACSGDDAPTRAVQLGQGMLDMAISDRWELESSSEEGRVYFHREHDALRLRFEARIENVGQPLRVRDLKSMVGRELNYEFGGVSTRVSFGGNAMIKYTREFQDEYDDSIHSEEWVLVRPAGFDDMTRVEISLWIPESMRSSPGIPALIEELDKQLGDARIPRA